MSECSSCLQAKGLCRFFNFSGPCTCVENGDSHHTLATWGVGPDKITHSRYSTSAQDPPSAASLPPAAFAPSDPAPWPLTPFQTPDAESCTRPLSSGERQTPMARKQASGVAGHGDGPPLRVHLSDGTLR